MRSRLILQLLVKAITVTITSSASFFLPIKRNIMSVTIESDLKEIFAKFEQKLDKLELKIDKVEQKIDNVAKDVNELKVSGAKTEAELRGDIKVLNESVARTEAVLKGDIKALDEKVDGLSKRLDSTEFVNRGILIGLIVAILGGLAKLFGLVGNP
jgi:peptidoglycan hydrolase CwlO-like protein